MNISERLANGLRSANLGGRSFAKVVGCHFTTIYRIIRETEPNLHGITEEVLERKIARLEELVASGQLPFDLGMTRKQKAEALQSLFAEHK